LRERRKVINQACRAVNAEAFWIEPTTAAEHSAGNVAIGTIRPAKIEKRRLAILGRLEVGEIDGAAGKRLFSGNCL
jgi:hypothetical protein